MAKSKWLILLEQIGPIVLATTPLAPLAPIVIAGIKVAEQIPGATGAQKKALVQQIVALGANGANAAAGKVVVTPSVITAASGQVIDSIVGVVNVAHDIADNKDTPPPTP